MTADVAYIVRNCTSCAWNNQKYRRRCNMHLFLASCPFQLTAMDIVGPVPKTASSNPLIPVTENCYFKLRRAVPTSKTTATYAVISFLYQWLILYGISTYLLTDKGIQFVSKLFATACALLGVKHLTTTAYFLKTNVQAE